MAAELLSFFRPAVGLRGDWSTQEIAEFYRVEAALVQAGVNVIVDRGISDEGDPWFVFCRLVDHEVIVHFARIAGKYVIATEVLGQILCGTDFRRLLTEFVSRNPTLVPLTPAKGGAKLLLHPASLLAAVVATALYYMSGTEALANSLDATAVHHHADDGAAHSLSGTSADFERKSLDRQLAAAAVAMVALATADFLQSSSDLHADVVQLLADVSDRSAGPHLVMGRESHDTDLLISQDVHLLSPDGAIVWYGDHTGSGSINAAGEQHPGPGRTANTPDSSPENAAPSSRISVDHLHSESLSVANSGSQDQTQNPSDVGGSAFGLNKTGIPFAGLEHQPAVKLDASQQDAGAVTSSTPDASLSNSFDAQTALASINSELGSHQPIAQITLAGNLSVEDVIVHTANDLLGKPSLTTSSLEEKASNPPVVTVSLSDHSSPEQSQTAVVSSATDSSSLNQDTAFHYPLFNDQATAAINAFVVLNSFEIITSNRNIILFDTTASDFSSPDLTVMTWSMHDGSTISIVGVLPHNIHA